ncbi:heterokaryon incompatibility protein-domain-containing protein [Phaeosphaeriaceae sp. PMI808]|nr:heterokaryon incompatibility protein-domain-containing protein [Phaeosphaeriaceae sp. PMI808]
MSPHKLYDDLQLPLPENTSLAYIRLLKLGCQSNGIQNDLKVFRLMNCPSYRALSYAWGNASDTLPLRINGIDLSVTRNLGSALTYLSAEYVGQWLWIDAICINQSKFALKEREYQANIMRDIYSEASEVLVWLGSSITTPSNKSGEQGKSRPLFTTCKAIDRTIRTSPFSGRDFDALLELPRQPYWNLVWIIQELVCANSVKLHTETDSIEWEDFKWVLTMLERCDTHNYRGLDANFSALLELRRVYHEENSFSSQRLADLLPLFRLSQATDKLDKVYSLIGLVTDEDRNLVKIEYNILSSKCYKQLMFKMLQQKRGLSLLIFCNPPGFVDSERRLPSWVID